MRSLGGGGLSGPLSPKCRGVRAVAGAAEAPEMCGPGLREADFLHQFCALPEFEPAPLRCPATTAIVAALDEVNPVNAIESRIPINRGVGGATVSSRLGDLNIALWGGG